MDDTPRTVAARNACCVGHDPDRAISVGPGSVILAHVISLAHIF